MRAKGSPGLSEVGPNVLLPLEEGVAASTETGPAADCVPSAGDFSATFVSWARVECSSVSVLVCAA